MCSCRSKRSGSISGIKNYDYCKMREIKRPYKNIKLHTGHNSSVKKPCIKDGRLYLGEGKGKGGAFPLPSIIASVTPTLISRLFGGKKKKESKKS